MLQHAPQHDCPHLTSEDHLAINIPLVSISTYVDNFDIRLNELLLLLFKLRHHGKIAVEKSPDVCVLR